MLWNVLAICFFIFAIFGIVAVQLWRGALRGRCFLELPQGVSKARFVPRHCSLYEKYVFVHRTGKHLRVSWNCSEELGIQRFLAAFLRLNYVY